MYPFASGFLISYVALLYCLVPRPVGELKLAQPVAFRTTFPGHWFPLGSSSDKQFSAFYVWCGRVPVHALVCSITHQNDRLGQGCVARQLKMIWFVWTECTALDRLGLSSCNLLAAAATTQRGCEPWCLNKGSSTLIQCAWSTKWCEDSALLKQQLSAEQGNQILCELSCFHFWESEMTKRNSPRAVKNRGLNQNHG
jgi:hypothetical protein